MPTAVACRACGDEAGGPSLLRDQALAGGGSYRVLRSTPKPGGLSLPWLAAIAEGARLLSVIGISRRRQVRWARRAAAHLR